MGLIRTVAPEVEPVSRDEAAFHLRIDTAQESTEGTSLDALIAAARGWVEARLHRALVTQTWALTLDEFPHLYCRDEYVARRQHPNRFAPDVYAIRLPWPNLLSVTSITYVDASGSTVTLATDQYQVDLGSLPGRVLPAFGTAWPATRWQANAVTITYTAGFGNAAEVPAEIKHAILLVLGDLYRTRESQLVGAGITVTANPAVDALLASHIVRGVD